MIIREARPADASAVAGVHVRAWQAGYRGLLPDAYLEGLRPEDRAGAYVLGDPDGPHPRTIAATGGHTVVGFATTGPCNDRDADGAGELLALRSATGETCRDIVWTVVLNRDDLPQYGIFTPTRNERAAALSFRLVLLMPPIWVAV